MTLATVVLLTLCFVRFKYVQGQATPNFGANLFRKKMATTCGPVRLGPGWNESSQISCAVSCRKRYRKTCHSFMYNKITKLCTPGSGVSTSQLPPSAKEGDLYVTDSCDSYPEFSVHSYNNLTTFAAYFPVPVNYTQASVTCQCLDSHLYVAKTPGEYDLFSSMASGWTWMGLDDLEEEGQFVWSEDHQQIDPLTMQAFAFEPDDARGRQDCVTGCGSQLDDDFCDSDYPFICEKTNSPC